MLENNNLRICSRLARRDIKFHRARSMLLMMAIALVCMLYTFSFSLGEMVREGYIHSYKIMYGSDSHIIFYDLNRTQAAALQGHAAVADSVRLSAIGTLSDEMMGYRSVKLAAVSAGWAKATEAVPLHGRMPEEKGEIALDELTIHSLAIPRQIGTEVTLRWTPADGEARTDTFRLCGWWDSLKGLSETCAWISEETAWELAPDLWESGHEALGVTLYRPGNLEEQAERMLADLGLGHITYTTNLACNEARKEYAGSEAMRFYRMGLIVVLCGILMIYNIVRISTQQNIRFYGRVKSLGMTPRQILVFSIERAAFLCVPAIVPGWLAGFALYAAVSPFVVVGMDQNPAFRFFRLWPFAAGALFTWLTALTACLLPMRMTAKSSPVQAMGFVEGQRRRGERKRKRRRTTTMLMALSGLTRQKGQSVLTALSLLLSLLILCGIWTQAVSYDEEVYVNSLALCDYRIEDASATSSIQRYNPRSRSITPELLHALESHPAVTRIGEISTMEVPLYADEKERAPIVDSYEGKDENGIVRKEFMANNPDLLAGYEKLRESGEYIGIVTGVRGAALKKALAQNFYLEGSFQSGLFATGRYVIAAGAASTLIRTTPPVGSKITVNGREFEIMAAVPYEGSLLSGADSKEAQFNVTYYMPMETFDELFPDHGIRNVTVDIDHGRQKEFEEFLADLLKDTGIAVTAYSDYQWNFRNAVFHNYMIPLFVGSVMLLIGILNFCNVLMTRIFVRKKEFAVYESLGMTGRQIRRVLLWEGVLYCGVMVLLLVPITAASTWVWGRWWLAHTNTWCVTWRYSLMPLWITIPVLFILAVTVPLQCLKTVRRESITERLRVAE